MASRYEQFFREADKDNSGYLTVDELIQLLRQKGYKASDDKIRVSLYYRPAACCPCVCPSISGWNKQTVMRGGII